MDAMSRWLVPAVVAAGAAIAALAPPPVRAREGDELVRALVDIADVVLRGGVPYYRHGNYGYDDRLIVGRDRYGRPVYYRQTPRRYIDRDRYYRDPYYGYRDGRRVKCNKHGKCTVTYYDPRYDRSAHRYDDRYYRDRRW